MWERHQKNLAIQERLKQQDAEQAQLQQSQDTQQLVAQP
jgi:hypothetical protein